MKTGKKMLVVIFVIITASILVAVFGIGNDIKGIKNMRYGIDIRGGVEAIFEPQGLGRTPTQSELEIARNVIEMRLDAQKITDREVTIDKEGGYIIVRFPWKSDETDFNPEDAIAELGQMAQLSFRDADGNILITGKNVKISSAEKQKSDINTEYLVSLTFDKEGAKLFEEATARLIGQQIGIYMDNELISNPVVQTKIPGGQAVINGMKDYEEAKVLSDKINSGALPFSLSTTSFSTISPSLGNNALNSMVMAGVIAFLLVCIFMIVYYKLPGIVACITLVLQMTLQLLSISIPQYTLTLPGIAGIILSLGMAVDANIIISERTSEELKKGCTVKSSVIAGFKNGFTSVLDGNITTAIVAIILMIFGSGSMLSFGYTLLLGMIINVFVGVMVSKKLLLSLIAFDKWNNGKWFRKNKDLKVKKFYEKKIICAMISGTVLVIGIIGCVGNGIKMDTQFTGGAVLNYTVSGEVSPDTIQKEVEKITDRSVMVQETRSNINKTSSLEITLSGTGGISPDEQKEITKVVQNTAHGIEVKLSQTFAVAPYIGTKAMKNAGIAIILSFVFIVIYVWIRFSTLSGLAAGLTAVIALFHDVLVCFFVFVIFRIPLNDAFVAVILTIIGYSINDTIVVYDRIRENKTDKQKLDVVELTNLSISQVLARSVNTSFTTAICVLTILGTALIYQIDSIVKFSLPMFFGLVSGCYSSVCIASILWAMWEKRKVRTGSDCTERKR